MDITTSEYEIIGAILHGQREMFETVYLVEHLRAEDLPTMGEVYKSIETLYASGMTITPENLTSNFSKSELQYLKDTFYGDERSVRASCRFLITDTERRKLLGKVQGAEKRLVKEGVDPEGVIKELSEALKVTRINEVFQTHVSEIVNRTESEVILSPTRLTELDRLLNGGLRTRRLVVIGGRQKGRKCVHPDTFIMTTNGMERIRDVVGEIPDGFTPKEIRVLGPNGWVNTSHVYKSAKSQTIRITTQRGFSIEATPEHPLMGLSGFIRTDEITEGTEIALSPFQINTGRQISLPKPNFTKSRWENRSIVLPEFLNERLSEFMGIIIAEGACGNNSLSISNGSSEILQFLDESAERWNINTRRYFKDNAWSIRYPSVFRKWLKDIGIGYSKSDGKRVPEIMFTAPEECVAAFISGYWSGDGYVSKKHQSGIAKIMVTTASEDLARDIQFLLLRLGILSRIHTKHNKAYNRNYHELAITGIDADIFAEKIHIRMASKQERLDAHLTASKTTNGLRKWRGGRRDTNGLVYDRVTRIEYGESETYDLTIPEGHAFWSNGFISHNTTIIREVSLSLLFDHKLKPRDKANITFMCFENDQWSTTWDFVGSLAAKILDSQGRLDEKANLLSSEILMEAYPRSRVDKAAPFFQWPADIQKAVERAVALIAEANLFIYDRSKEGGKLSDVDSIERVIASHSYNFLKEGQHPVFVIDYAQLVKHNSDLYIHMSNLSSQCIEWVNKYGCTIVCLSQFNEAYNKETASGVQTDYIGTKGGGDLESACHTYITTGYNSDTPDRLSIHVKRQRRGGTGNFDVRIHPTTGHIR